MSNLIYSAADLKGLPEKPRINDIDLPVIQEYYERYLNPFIYKYTVSYDDGSSKEIELRFDEENFCHLLGIESIAKKAVSRNDLHNYSGQGGWDNIKKGSMNIQHLKVLNKKKFSSVKAKYVYFYLLPNLISDPLAIKYDKSMVDPPTKIECEIMFYSTYDDAVIHLGLEYSDAKNYYVPRTFFVEKMKNNPVDVYIQNQEKLVVRVDERVVML